HRAHGCIPYRAYSRKAGLRFTSSGRRLGGRAGSVRLRAATSVGRPDDALIQAGRMARGLPPWALEPAVGAAGPVEPVEGGHVLVRKGEVEDLGIFCDPLAMRRLGDHYQVMLQGPAQQDLRRGASD